MLQLLLLCAGRQAVLLACSRSVSGVRGRRRGVCESTGFETECGNPRHGLPVCNTRALVRASAEGGVPHIFLLRTHTPGSAGPITSAHGLGPARAPGPPARGPARTARPQPSPSHSEV